MRRHRPHPLTNVTEQFSAAVTRWTGSTMAFSLACLVVVVWAATGPLFGFSDTWQLVINTGTTVVTFLMVFLIQRSQNKDSLAIQLKLNELVAAVSGASNRLIDCEDMNEEELQDPPSALRDARGHGEKGSLADHVPLGRGSDRNGTRAKRGRSDEDASQRPARIHAATVSMIPSSTSPLRAGTLKE